MSSITGRESLEEAGAEYDDVARRSGGMVTMQRLMNGAGAHPPFAPPFLKDGDILIAQTANILLFSVAACPWHHDTKPGGYGRISCS
jgi:hypothetical protein